MKITYIEIEASGEDLRATRTLGESLSMALDRVFSRMGNIRVPDDEDLEENDGQEDEG